MDGSRIFVSHSSKDNAFVTRLVKDLRQVLGNKDAVWHDSGGSLHAGDLWWRKIVEELQAREIFIVVLSPDAVQSSYVNLEIDLAWHEKHRNWSRLIVPILYSECAVRADLDVLHIVRFLPPKEYDEAFNELLAALQLSVEGQAALTQEAAIMLSDLEVLQLPTKVQKEQAEKKRLVEEEKQRRIEQRPVRPAKNVKLPPGSPQQGISRRRVVIGLTGLTVVGLAGGSLEALSHIIPSLYHPSHPATPTFPPSPILKGIYVAWVGTKDQQLNIASVIFASDQTPSLKPFFHGSDTNGTSPSLAVTSSTLYIAWTGKDRQIYLSTYDGKKMGKSYPLYGLTSNLSPALAIFDDLLYVAWTGTNQQLNIASVTFASGQPSPYPLFEGQSSYSSPALAATSSTLYIGWTGTKDQQLNIASTTFTSDQLLSLKTVSYGLYTNGTSPALAASSSTLYIGWIGTDQQLNIASSSDQLPTTIQLTPLAPYSNGTSPTLTYFDNLIYIGWTGTNQELSIASYAPGQTKLQMNSNSLRQKSYKTPALASSMPGSK